MFCTKCGKEIPDNSAFCGYCGASFAADSAATVVAAPVEQRLTARQRGLSKKQFLATDAAPAVKTAGKLAMAVFAVILVLVLLATYTVNTISIVNLPIIKMAVEENEREEMLDSMDEAADAMDEMDDLLEEIEDEFGSKTAREAKKVVKKWEKVVRKTSLANLISVVDATHNLADEVSDKLGMDDDIEELEEIAKILKTVRSITYGFGIAIVLFALLAAVCKKTGLSIFCIFLSVPVYCLLASVLLGILMLVAFIVLAVFTSKVNKAYKHVAY